jgi:RNA polymerase sigma-70 factor (ECF subfamily)
MPWYTAAAPAVPRNRSAPGGVGRASAHPEAALDDTDLVAEATAGDLAAFDLLVARHQDVAMRVATLTAGPGHAPDAVQEAFVKAWRALPRFRPGAPFRPWLLKIVANEARNAARAAGRREALAVRSVAVAAGSDEPLDAVAIAAEQRDQLVRSLERLSDADREIIAYRYFSEIPERDIAAALEGRPGTVKSRLSRALERLRVAYDAEATTPPLRGGVHD